MTRAVVLDANVLMRAVLGRKVDRLLERFAAEVSFAAPDVAFADVRGGVGGQVLPFAIRRAWLPTRRSGPWQASVLRGWPPRLGGGKRQDLTLTFRELAIANTIANTPH